GLLDDDHPQYLTEGRGDVRYYTREQAAQLIANAVSAAAPANRDRSNHTGVQSISTITNLESRLAALEAGGGGGSGILAVPVGDDLPLGIPAGSWVGRIPDDSVPPATLFEAISYDSEGTTVSCPVPSGVAVGDAVIFIPAFDRAGTATNDITVSDAGWSESFDYSANQARATAVYVDPGTESPAPATPGPHRDHRHPRERCRLVRDLRLQRHPCAGDRRLRVPRDGLDGAGRARLDGVGHLRQLRAAHGRVLHRARVPGRLGVARLHLGI